MLSASGALLQPPESGSEGAAAAPSSSAEGGAQPGGAAGVTSIMAEIGDEDSKGGGGDELGGGGDRGFLGGGSGGNRWPRQETLALLKIRSDMDGVFRDSSHKGPLWEEVARKMAELGYERSAKKCKEKFENVYKYHKRTKEGRATKSDGKTYRFFDQLEALETQHQHQHQYSSSLQQLPADPPRPEAAVPLSMAMPPPPPSAIAATTQQQGVGVGVGTVPSTTTNPLPISHCSTVAQQVTTGNPLPVQTALMPAIHRIPPGQPSPMQNANVPITSFPSSPSGSPSTSSTSSDEEILGMKRKRKRKWKDFLERIMREVISKQEELQRKFLEAIEKREQDRMAREEAWKMHEMARLNREHEILVQERSMAAAKDAALISFLQQLSDQQQIPLPPSIIQPQPQPQPRPPAPTTPTPVPISQAQDKNIPNIATTVQLQTQLLPQQPEVGTGTAASNAEPVRANNIGDPKTSYLGATSSRWPKTEVEALINLKTTLDQKYQDSGPKGPLWEEISSAMKKLGYNRSAKRCKEKWENINKYFKKVKESNKKRPEDSKTCPYFHQLDAIYREKNKAESIGYGAKTHQPAAGEEAMAPPIMARPEQQWPLPPQQEHGRRESDNIDDDRDEDDDNDDDDEEDEEDDDDQGGGFEIVPNNNNASSMGGATASAPMDNS